MGRCSLQTILCTRRTFPCSVKLESWLSALFCGCHKLFCHEKGYLYESTCTKSSATNSPHPSPPLLGSSEPPTGRHCQSCSFVPVHVWTDPPPGPLTERERCKCVHWHQHQKRHILQKRNKLATNSTTRHSTSCLAKCFAGNKSERTLNSLSPLLKKQIQCT